MVAQEPESTSKEARMEFIADYTLKTLRLKPDKWARMIVSDEQRNFILSFLDKGKKKIYIFALFYIYLYIIWKIEVVVGTYTG